MKKTEIRRKLRGHLYEPSDTIELEILKGTPRSKEGGVWVEVRVEDMENLTEDADFDPIKSGWKKYLDKWYEEGLITESEKVRGKSWK